MKKTFTPKSRGGSSSFGKQNNFRKSSSFGAKTSSGHKKKTGYKSISVSTKSGYSSTSSSSKFRSSKPVSGFRGRSGSFGGRKTSSKKKSTFNPSQFINKNPVQVETTNYVNQHTTFAEFAISDGLIKTLSAMGITSPTPIQDQVVGLALKKKDIIGMAETGTGKTLAFLLPLVEMALSDKNQQVLIVAPTRELAMQINQELRRLTNGLDIYSTVCVGGAGIGAQIRTLRMKNHFIIGTPGRLKDLSNRGNLNLKKISKVVLDEADRMLDMGFIGDIRLLLSGVSSERQTLLFSATMNKLAEQLASEFLQDPVIVSVKKQDVTSSIAQDVVRFSPENKFNVLADLVRQAEFARVIVFGAMKYSVEQLTQDLLSAGIKATSIHGNKNHAQRQRALHSFKSGQVKVLVATDVAARGIHIDNVTHVVNYDLPSTFEDYVHRIGRTGRGDKSGQALTFVRH